MRWIETIKHCCANSGFLTGTSQEALTNKVKARGGTRSALWAGDSYVTSIASWIYTQTWDAHRISEKNAHSMGTYLLILKSTEIVLVLNWTPPLRRYSNLGDLSQWKSMNDSNSWPCHQLWRELAAWFCHQLSGRCSLFSWLLFWTRRRKREYQQTTGWVCLGFSM